MQHIPGPNFAKSSFRRASSFNQNGAINQEIIEKQQETPGGKSKLRFVQLEIAENEACRLLNFLIRETAENLPPSEKNDIEITDLLTGILMLGNMCKRMAIAKSNVEEALTKSKMDYSNMQADKDSLIYQLEGVILKLRDENVKATDQLTENSMKHEQKMTVLQKELTATKDSQLEYKSEIQRLQLKISNLERRIMEIPRLEEKYLRTARGIVKQQEATTTQKEVGFKKLEEDVKSLQYYKNKTIQLEEQIFKQRNDVENYATQARVALSKYQTLLTTYNQEKRQIQKDAERRQHNESFTKRPQSAPLKRQTTMKINDITITSRNELISSQNSRSSTPTQHVKIMSNMHKSKSGLSKSFINAGSSPDFELEQLNHTNNLNNITKFFENSLENYENNSPKKENRIKTPKNATFQDINTTFDDEKHTFPDHNQTSAFDNTANNTMKNTNNQQNKSIEQIQAEDIAKLRFANEQKEAHIIRLSQKLAYSRSYPLYGVDEPEPTDKDTEENQAFLNEKNRMNKPKYNMYGSGKDNVKAFFHSLDDMDAESISEEYQQTEKTLINQRFEAAVQMEEEYRHRILRTKAKNPPHVEAIRSSRSFAKPKEEDKPIEYKLFNSKRK